MGVGFTFDDAVMKFLPEQPPIIQLDGYGALTGKRLTIVADRAFIQATDDALLDASGTVFAIGDTDARPGVADIDIRVQGPLEAQLALLDRPPFRFLSRAGQPTDVATGQATTTARVSLPLLKIVPDDQIYYSVDAQAQNVQSDKLIPGHVLKADRLAITADRRDGLKIAGRATVSGIPVEGSWIMPLDESSDGSSRLTGAVNVSQETSDVFALGLPDRTISGTGLGRVEIDFPNKATPKLRFFTDLNRIRLSLPPIGWSKSAQRTGEFEILVDLADPPHVTALTLDAPGLKASGSVTLDSEGALELAAFKELRIGRWFNGNIELIGRGANVPFDIAVKGGRMDLRSSEFGTSSGNGAGALA